MQEFGSSDDFKDWISPDSFRESFIDKANDLVDQAGSEVLASVVKRSYDMWNADKFWIAAGVAVTLLVRDRRHVRKIKTLVEMNGKLHVENKILYLLVDGTINEKDIKTLAKAV